MENYKKKALQLIVDLTIAQNKNPSVIPYIPQKTEINGEETEYFDHKCVGKNSKLQNTLIAMLKELENEPRANVHNIMVIKDGDAILKASAPGYETNIFHLAHSMSKTITGLAIGFLYDREMLNLNEKVKDFFPEESFKDEKLNSMTVYHLLAMRSGIKFAELGTVTEDKWTHAFFESEYAFEPGSEFMYNSMNSYILTRIVEKVSKTSFERFIDENLFSSLGIKNYFWEKGPEEIEKGGFGLYLSCESFAKIGVMILNNGYFGERKIISEEFLALMTSLHSKVPEEKTGFNYGLHVWVDEENNETLLNGMLGQNVWISYKNRIVVSMNSGNNELFSDSPALSIVRKYLSNIENKSQTSHKAAKELKKAENNFFVSREPIKPLQKKRGLPYLLGLKNRCPFDNRWENLLGTYAFRDNNASILPVFVSILQNNFSGGIEFFSFEKSKEDLTLISTEGKEDHKINIGLYDFKESILNFNGESYIVRAMAEASQNDFGKPIYKIHLVFPELPNTVLFNIEHTENGIKIQKNELPNENIAESYFNSIMPNSKFGFINSILEKTMGSGFLKEKLTALFNPVFDTISTNYENWQNIISEDNKRLKNEREKSSKFIKSLLPKIENDEKTEKPKEEKVGIQGFFAKALSLLLGKAKRDDIQSENDYPPQEKPSNDLIIEIPDDVITFLDSETEE